MTFFWRCNNRTAVICFAPRHCAIINKIWRGVPTSVCACHVAGVAPFTFFFADGCNHKSAFFAWNQSARYVRAEGRYSSHQTAAASTISAATNSLKNDCHEYIICSYVASTKPTWRCNWCIAQEEKMRASPLVNVS